MPSSSHSLLLHVCLCSNNLFSYKDDTMWSYLNIITFSNIYFKYNHTLVLVNHILGWTWILVEHNSIQHWWLCQNNKIMCWLGDQGPSLTNQYSLEPSMGNIVSTPLYTCKCLMGYMDELVIGWIRTLRVEKPINCIRLSFNHTMSPKIKQQC